MNILEQLNNLMLKKIEIKKFPKNELDDFLSHNNIVICDEYYDFLLNYGNSNFLKYSYANLTFDYIKLYYLDNDIIDDAKLPPNCDYIGSDFSTEALCLDHHDKNIYLFGGGEKDLWHYGGLKEILFFCLFGYIKHSELFHHIKRNIKIDDVHEFKKNYSDYEIKNLHFGKKYFFKEGIFIISNDNFYSYHLYEGGILNHIIDDRP